MNFFIPLSRFLPRGALEIDMEKNKFFDTSAYALFAGILLLELLFIRPFGNFPLYDDWTPALSVASFTGSGTFFYPAYLSAFSFVPILYGIAVSMVFGFSFGVLRLTTILLAWGCACLLYSFLRRSDFSVRTSIDSTLLMLVSPLFVFLSNTFMSDIPGLFFLLAALYFFSRGFRERRYSLIIIGACCSLFGFFTRQFNILLLLAGAGSYFFYPYMNRKVGMVLWGAIGLVFFGVWALIMNAGVVPATPIVLYLPPDSGQRISQSLLFTILIAIFFCASFAPFILARKGWMGIWRSMHSYKALYLTLFASTISAILYYLFPRFLTVISYFGLGTVPFFMRGDIPLWGWPAVYIIVLAGCLLLASWLFRRVSVIFDLVKEQPWNAFLLYFGVLYGLTIIIFVPFFDRYFLFFLPIICYINAYVLKKYAVSHVVYYGMLSIIALYSIVGVYNYIGWNDARWRLGERIVTSGIPREKINGGYEWNGWFFYKDGLDGSIREGSQKNLGAYIDNFLFFRDTEYLLSFSPLTSTRVIDAENVRGLFSNIKRIYALQKINQE